MLRTIAGCEDVPFFYGGMSSWTFQSVHEILHEIFEEFRSNIICIISPMVVYIEEIIGI